MDIYTFVSLLSDTDNMVFSVFDCNQCEVVFVDVDGEDKRDLTAEDLLWSKYADCEIGGVDTWIDNGTIHFEFNVDVEEGCYD